MNHYDSTLHRLQHWIHRLEDGLLMLLLSSMILLATSQILLRNLWDTGLAWADPTLRIAVLWVALLGALAATRDDNHIRIDLLTRFLPDWAKRYALMITDLFSALVCGLLAWHGGRFVYFEWQDGNTLYSSVPAWLCELIIPVGFGLMSLRFLLAAWLRIQGRKTT